jgi:hypothetical protein
MTFHPKGLLVGLLVLGLFCSTLLLAIDFRLGLTATLVGLIAYILIESGSVGFGYGLLTGRRRKSQ